MMMGIIIVFVKLGFKNGLIISIILLVLFGCYAKYVHNLYYKLPKNKRDAIGILFYINTHGNHLDYKSITNKFCERFEELSEMIQQYKLYPIILTEKQVSVIKNISIDNTKINLLNKTNCDFGIFMKATDCGQSSDEYELQIHGTLSHPKLNNDLDKLLSHNFNYVFQDLHSNTINKKNDLENLQILSTQLYYICQLMIGAIDKYSGFPQRALKLFMEMESKINNASSKFYRQLFLILKYEICSCIIAIADTEYKNFIFDGIYNKDVVKESLDIMKDTLRKISHINFTINYHLAKSVYHVMCGNIIEAKGEISLLDKYFKTIEFNQRPWIYSEAFLVALENKPNKYKTINTKYKTLKNNKTQEPLNIYYFIIAFLERQPNNLGLKLAQLLLVYYKKDEFNINILPENLQQEIVLELNNLNQCNFARFIEDLRF